MTNQTDIARIRAELKRTQALMKQTKGTPDYDQLWQVSQALNIALSRVGKRQSNGV